MRFLKARNRREEGQSFVELALVIPLLLIVLAGLTEVGFYMFTYLNALDLTREAARFASTRDFNHGRLSGVVPLSACSDNVLDYYYDTACFFVDPQLNPWLPIDPNNYDDVTISVFSVDDNNVISKRFPLPNGVWSLYNNNWQKDCNGNVVTTQPDISNATIQNDFMSGAPHSKGLVLVEVYYCYHQILNLPFFSQFMSNPVRMHAYSIMPAPAAIPTPTPIP